MAPVERAGINREKRRQDAAQNVAQALKDIGRLAAPPADRRLAFRDVIPTAWLDREVAVAGGLFPFAIDLDHRAAGIRDRDLGRQIVAQIEAQIVGHAGACRNGVGTAPAASAGDQASILNIGQGASQP